MGITCDRGRYYWVKRIPKRYAGVVIGADGNPVSQVRAALHTDSKSEAQRKAGQVEAARLAEWESLLVGDTQGAARHYANAQRLAEARGFAYVPISDLAGAPVEEILARVLSLRPAAGEMESPVVAAAVLGTVPVAMPALPDLLDEYVGLVATRHSEKSAAQEKKWLAPRQRAIRNFIDAACERDKAGNPVDLPVDKITRDHALKYRAALQRRINDGLMIASANKEVGQLNEVVSTWIKLKKVPFESPFADLAFEGGKDEGRTRPPFSREWVVGKLFAPGALDGLNVEARDVLAIIANTGARESEVTDTPPEDFVLDAPIPYLRIIPNGRQLKQGHTKRDIPLLGMALDAAKRIKAQGGSRYMHKASSFSALVNKYMTNNDLRETPDHTVYCLRHYVEDQLQAAGADDRIRADILGHKYHRPKYGDGGALIGRKQFLEKFAI